MNKRLKRQIDTGKNKAHTVYLNIYTRDDPGIHTLKLPINQ